ncbi:MAG TPA: TIGR02710 family CRISPR-associated CARF protein [Methanospirillum sp.]|nr:TIGR02710 family CRISPR-associated CARF protein [Methanospirillum sp.]
MDQMYLLMTVGTGIGNDPADAEERLAKSCSYAISSYKPEHIIFFCSSESRELIPAIKRMYEDITKMPPPPDEICLIDNPTNFPRCFEIIYGVSVLFQEFEIVIDASSGTREMTMAAAITSFLTRSLVSYVTGRKEAGKIVSGTEHLREMTLYAAYDHLMFHQAVDLFNGSHFGAALEHLKGITAVADRDAYYGIFSAYYYWDKLNYQAAFRYLEHAPDLNPSIPQNREYLQILLNLEELEDSDMPRKDQNRARQKKYLYILVDLLNNAKRRIEGERYDDALARLYRVVELLSQVLLMSWGIDDIEGKIHFTDLRKILRDKKDIATYARRADNKGVIRIGLRSKFMLLEDLGLAGAASYYQHLEPFLRTRNDSILAHGLTPVPGERARRMWQEVYEIVNRACSGMPFDLEGLLVRSAYPALEIPIW